MTQDVQDDEDQSKLKASAVGGVTTGDVGKYVAASNGKGASVQPEISTDAGALEAASHQQGETDKHSELPENLPKVHRSSSLSASYISRHPAMRFKGIPSIPVLGFCLPNGRLLFRHQV